MFLGIGHTPNADFVGDQLASRWRRLPDSSDGHVCTRFPASSSPETWPIATTARPLPLPAPAAWPRSKSRSTWKRSGSNTWVQLFHVRENTACVAALVRFDLGLAPQGLKILPQDFSPGLDEDVSESRRTAEAPRHSETNTAKTPLFEIAQTEMPTPTLSQSTRPIHPRRSKRRNSFCRVPPCVLALRSCSAPDSGASPTNWRMRSAFRTRRSRLFREALRSATPATW